MSTHASDQTVTAGHAPETRADLTPATARRLGEAATAPFKPKSLERIDEALTMASRETGIYFSLYVGRLTGDSRRVAESLHPRMGAKAPNGVLVAVDPGHRVLEIVTGRQSVKRLPDRACALAALSMTAAFGSGDLVGGIVNGLRMLSDQAGHPHRLR